MDLASRSRDNVGSNSSLASAGSSSSAVSSGSTPLWDAVRCEELVDSQQALVIDADEAVDSVREDLVAQGFMSCPVYDEAHSRYVGLFDDQDLLSLLLRQMDGGGDVLALNMPVKFATDMSGRNPFNAVDPKAALGVAMRHLARGCRRVPLVRGGSAEGGRDVLSGLLTQSAVVAYLARKETLGRLGPIVNKTLGELDFGGAGKRPLMIEWREVTVFEALRRMHQRGVTAVPLVEDGVLCDTLTLTDVRSLLASRSREPFEASCVEYVRELRQRAAGRAAAAEAALHAKNKRKGLGGSSAAAAGRRSSALVSGGGPFSAAAAAAAAAAQSPSSSRRGTARGSTARRSSAIGAQRSRRAAQTVKAAPRAAPHQSARASQRKMSSLERDEDFFRKVSAYLNPKKKSWQNKPYLTLSATLGDALQQVTAMGMHRLWIVDSPEARRVTGVASLTDLLAAAFSARPAAAPSRASLVL